jgi:hypothetical protein
VSDKQSPSVAETNSMTENAGGAQSQTEAAPKKRRRWWVVLFEVLLALVLIGTLAVKFTQPGEELWDVLAHGRYKAAEKAAGAKLQEKKADGHFHMIIAEKQIPTSFLALLAHDWLKLPDDKRVTNITFDASLPMDEATLTLVADLYRLSTVNADKCKLTDDNLKYFSGLTSLVNLMLAGTPITDAGLVHLRPLGGNLETLYVQDTKISDAGMDVVGSLDNLKILNLSNTKITDAGVKKLARLPHLNWLLMCNTAITDAAVDDLAAMPKLGRLTITGSKMTPAAIDRLQKANAKLKVE